MGHSTVVVEQKIGVRRGPINPHVKHGNPLGRLPLGRIHWADNSEASVEFCPPIRINLAHNVSVNPECDDKLTERKIARKSRI